MMRRLVFALAAALAACGQSSAPPAETPIDPAAAAQVAGKIQPLGHTLPPVSQRPRFVGAWSTTGEGCSAPAWTINAGGMHTQGEVSCSFTNVSEIPAGYAVDAACTAEGAQTQHHMQFTFAESAQAMMIAGGPWSPEPGLVYCGPAAP